MGRALALVAFLAVIGLSLVWPKAEVVVPDPAEAAGECRIFGLVTDHGFPIAAKITIRCERLRRTLEAGEDGQFSADGFPAGDYVVEARCADGRIGFARAELDLPGESRNCTVDLEDRPLTIRGRARWADGRPFSGTVEHWPFTVATDTEGRFAIPHARKPTTLRFEVEGEFVRRLGPFDQPEIEVTVDEGLAFREGRVTARATGEPVAGAQVGFLGREMIRAWTTSNGRGRFRILASEEGTLHARADGLVSESIGLSPGVLEFALERQPTVTGHVRTPEGTPLVGVTVWSLDLPRGFGADPVATDERGAYTIDGLREGAVMIYVLGNGYASPDIRHATADGYNPLAITLRTGERRVVNLVAVRAPSLSGLVTDTGGRPVPSLRVELNETELCKRDELVTLTDERGRYRFETIMPGATVTVRAISPRWDDVEADPVTVEPGTEATVNLTLPDPPDRWVELRVLDAATGQPIGKARISGEYSTLGETGADGRFRLGPLPDGPFPLRIRHPEYVTKLEEKIPDSGVIRLEPGVVMAGRVLLLDGSPAVKAGVRVGPVSVQTDDQGRFRTKRVPTGVHPVSVSAHFQGKLFYRGKTQATAGDEKIVLTVKVLSSNEGPYWAKSRAAAQGPMVEIVLVDEAGHPVGEGTVGFITRKKFGKNLARPGHPDFSPFTVGRVEFVFDRYEEQVWIDVDPLAERLERVLVGPLKRGSLKRTLTLKSARSVNGRVLAPDGSGIRGARVFIFPANDWLDDEWGRPPCHGSTWCDADGRFEFGGLGSGGFHLTVAGPPGYYLKDMAWCEAGDTDVEIRLKAAARPTVTVLDDGGTSLKGFIVHVHARHAETPYFEWSAIERHVTNELGQVRFQSLDPARTYVLVVEPEFEEDTDLREKQIVGWSPADATVRLSNRRTVTGVVLDRDDVPVAYARLWMKSETDWVKVGVKEDGSFRIRKVPPGPLKLIAGPYGSTLKGPGKESFTFDPDETEIEVAIGESHWIETRIIDFPKGAQVRAILQFGSTRRFLRVKEDGTVRFHGLPEGRSYQFYAGPFPGGTMAYGEDLELDAENEIAVCPGKSIRGKLEMPEGMREIDIRARWNDISLPGRLEAGGRYVIEGLPDGNWYVFVHGRIGRQKYSGKVRVDAGGTADITLTPSD